MLLTKAMMVTTSMSLTGMLVFCYFRINPLSVFLSILGAVVITLASRLLGVGFNSWPYLKCQSW